jgi:hypothetical protein
MNAGGRIQEAKGKRQKAEFYILPFTLCICLLLIHQVTAISGTLFVDDDACCYIVDWTGLSFSPPTVEWRLADGLDYDTTGAAAYRNYGAFLLVTNLTDGNRPGLSEGPLRSGQSSLEFDGVNDYLQVNDVTVLDCNNEDLTIAAWIRLESAVLGRIAGKKLSSTIAAGYGLGVDASRQPFLRCADGTS